MKKKYGSFLESGKLADCIRWLENSVPEADLVHSDVPRTQTGYPLIHIASQPSAPAAGTFEGAHPLIRTTSFAPRDAIGFVHPRVT
jgi:hypothetical protein